ncbi:O-antigen ligase family protein [Algibacter mikhailovii]|uniref:O-antigen ligase family protein n=1 Tax=Algibacter mikhailovii TaxID=425498 RepID=UPI002495217A|nr:O-antigen ligase family protein [Algibacter mikhailovii]
MSLLICNKSESLHNLVKYLLVFTGAFVLLPFNLRGLIVILFLLLGVYGFFIRNKKPSSLLLLINTLLYACYVLSLVYTHNYQAGLGFLATTLSLLVMPISLILVSYNKEIIKTLIYNKTLFFYSFYFSCSLLSALILFKAFSFLDIPNNRILINPFLNVLETDFYWLSDHPIYLSLAISLSLILIFTFFKVKLKRGVIILLLIGFILQLIVLIIMSRKSVLIAFFLVFFIRVLILKGLSIKSFLYAALFLGAVSLVTLQLSSDTVKRFKEVFDKKSYEKVEESSSTSIRYFVYDCSIQVISESILFGYGIGDVKSELKKCYKSVSKVLYEGNYNSHNQYLGILLYVGVLGLILFLIMLGCNFRLFFISGDYTSFCVLLTFVIIMLFENILDRQNGVILFSLFINYLGLINLEEIE